MDVRPRDIPYARSYFYRRTIVFLMVFVAFALLAALPTQVSADWMALVVGVLTAYLVVVGLSPMLTKHTLTRSRIILRQGWYFRCIIPFSDIEAIGPYDGEPRFGLRLSMSGGRSDDGFLEVVVGILSTAVGLTSLLIVQIPVIFVGALFFGPIILIMGIVKMMGSGGGPGALLYVVGGRNHLVSVRLKEPRRFPLVLFLTASEIVFDVDDRERFLAAVTERRAAGTPLPARKIPVLPPARP